jgi:Na+/H+-translocating membrane pyrophosphatase
MSSTVLDGVLTTFSFVTGAVTSMVKENEIIHILDVVSPSFQIAGYIGMKVAVFSNARTTKAAAQNHGSMQYTAAFNMAFRAGEQFFPNVAQSW